MEIGIAFFGSGSVDSEPTHERPDHSRLFFGASEKAIAST